MIRGMFNVCVSMLLFGSICSAGVMCNISTITDDGLGNVTIGIGYTTDVAISGVEIDLLHDSALTVTGGAGGAAAAAGFAISTNSEGKIIAFSFTGAQIPVVSENTLLFEMTAEYDPSLVGNSVILDAVEEDLDGDGSLDNRLLFSDGSGSAIDADFHEASWNVGTGDFTLGMQPETTKLNANYPNPFNPTTTISYYLENAGNVEVIVYDLMGREIKTLVSDFVPAGQQHVIWDATNNDGVEVSAGTYIYKMVAGSYSKVDKMQYIK